jgi:hypothetical protein
MKMELYITVELKARLGEEKEIVDKIARISTLPHRHLSASK